MRSRIPVLTVLASLLVALGQLPARSAAQTASPQGKAWAVVIGINDYHKAPRLHYAIQDATAVGDLLEQQGFTVIRKVFPKDTTRQAIETVLGTELPKRLGSNDRVLVFFSGHGQDDPNSEGTKMGYLLPIEANPENLAATAISMGRVREWANFWRAKHVLFIVDSCYSGIIGENTKSIPAMTAQYVNQITREKARQLIVAGEADQEALEIGEWGQSLLTHFLLEGLGKNKAADLNTDGIIPTSELYQFLDRRVYEEAQLRGGREQRPRQFSLSGDKGEFVFLLPGQGDQQRPVQPVRIPTPSFSAVPSPRIDGGASPNQQLIGRWSMVTGNSAVSYVFYANGHYERSSQVNNEGQARSFEQQGKYRLQGNELLTVPDKTNQPTMRYQINWDEEMIQDRRIRTITLLGELPGSVLGSRPVPFEEHYQYQGQP